MNTRLKLPFLATASLFLVGLYVLISILSVTQDVVLPLIFASIIASSLSPAVNFLVDRKINRALSIAFVLAVAFLILIGLALLLSSQATMLKESWPQLVDKFEALLNQIIDWGANYFNVSTKKINAWLTDTKNDLFSNSGAAIGVTLTTMGGMLAIIF